MAIRQRRVDPHASAQTEGKQRVSEDFQTRFQKKAIADQATQQAAQKKKGWMDMGTSILTSMGTDMLINVAMNMILPGSGMLTAILSKGKNLTDLGEGMSKVKKAAEFTKVLGKGMKSMDDFNNMSKLAKNAISVGTSLAKVGA